MALAFRVCRCYFLEASSKTVLNTAFFPYLKALCNGIHELSTEEPNITISSSYCSFSVTLDLEKSQTLILMEYRNSNNPPSSDSAPQPPNTYRPLSTETEQSIRSRNSNSRCVVHVMLLLVMWFLILCFVFYIAWLIINPHKPNFRLNSLSVSNISLSNSQFAASYEVEFIVNNTNKKVNVTIDDIKITVFYGKNVVSERVLEKFVCYVGKLSQENLRAELGMDSIHSVKREVFKEMSDDWSKKMVNFNVKMSLRIRYGFGIWPSKENSVGVSCMNLAVEFVSMKGTGKLIGGGKFCVAHVL